MPKLLIEYSTVLLIFFFFFTKILIWRQYKSTKLGKTDIDATEKINLTLPKLLHSYTIVFKFMDEEKFY